MQLIALTGTMGSGKTTVARYLETKGYIRHNFKDTLLQEVKKRFPHLLMEINSYYTYKDTDELLDAVPRPPLVRALLQNYGTEVRRGDDPEYWVRRWAMTLPTGKPVVADDCRFINEALAVERHGGVIWRINGMTDGTMDHPSETEQAKMIVNRIITNHGRNLQDLYDQVDYALQEMRKREHVEA